jgi:hypothetical protein
MHPGADGGIASVNRMRNRHASLIERLARPLSISGERAIDGISRQSALIAETRVAKRGPQNAYLKQSCGVAEFLFVLDPYLRQPGPQISRAGAERNRDMRERDRVERRDNHFVLTRHDFPAPIFELQISAAQPRLVENPVGRLKRAVHRPRPEEIDLHPA